MLFCPFEKTREICHLLCLQSKFWLELYTCKEELCHSYYEQQLSWRFIFIFFYFQNLPESFIVFVYIQYYFRSSVLSKREKSAFSMYVVLSSIGLSSDIVFSGNPCMIFDFVDEFLYGGPQDLQGESSKSHTPTVEISKSILKVLLWPTIRSACK